VNGDWREEELDEGARDRIVVDAMLRIKSSIYGPDPAPPATSGTAAGTTGPVRNV